MSRLRKVLVGVGAVAIVAASVVVFSVRPNDDIEWLRKYGAKEIVSSREYVTPRLSLVSVTHEFQFNGPIPQGAKDGVKQFARVLTAKPREIENQQLVFMNPIASKISYTRSWAPNWLEVQWLDLRKKLGLRP